MPNSYLDNLTAHWQNLGLLPLPDHDARHDAEPEYADTHCEAATPEHTVHVTAMYRLQDLARTLLNTSFSNIHEFANLASDNTSLSNELNTTRIQLYEANAHIHQLTLALQALRGLVLRELDTTIPAITDPPDGEHLLNRLALALCDHVLGITAEEDDEIIIHDDDAEHNTPRRKLPYDGNPQA